MFPLIGISFFEMPHLLFSSLHDNCWVLWDKMKKNKIKIASGLSKVMLEEQGVFEISAPQLHLNKMFISKTPHPPRVIF